MTNGNNPVKRYEAVVGLVVEATPCGGVTDMGFWSGSR